MDFKGHYQDKDVVNSYDSLRNKGLKGRVIRKLELRYVDYLTGSPKEQSILEVGVGTGFISKMLIRKGNFSGIDTSQEMLDVTKRLLGDVKLSVGDIKNLKIKNKFDKAVTIRVISHFYKKDAIIALNSLNLALKENGELVFNLENRSLFRRLARGILRWGSTYNYQYSKREIYEIAKKSDFNVSEVIYLDHLFILPFHLLNKLSFNKLENFIFNLEWRLRNIGFMSNNSFIKCKK